MIDLGAFVVMMLTTLMSAGFSQDIRAQSGFEMAAPAGWHRITSEGIVENLGRMSMSPADMRKLLANAAQSTVVVAYVKYQPASHAGLIPKIQVVLRRNPAKTFDGFFRAVSESTAQLKTYFPDFELTEPAHEVPVGGKRAVRFGGTYSMETKSAVRLHVRTHAYAVMDDEAFFQITFTDGSDDDCSAVFDALLRTIRFE